MKQKPAYKHLVQKPQLCFAAIVSTVCLRHSYWLDQEVIAQYLGLKVTQEVSMANPRLRVTKNILDAGYDVQKIKIKNLNGLFNKNKIPLKAKFFKISQIKDVDKFIVDNLKQSNDIGMLFLWRGLGRDVAWGHWVLISAYTKGMLEVCDPSQSNVSKSFWKKKIESFLLGMSDKWDGRERGFLVFENLKK